MATADADLENSEEFIDLRAVLSRCISVVRNKLGIREHELSVQLETMVREDLKRKEILSSDKNLLSNTIEQIRSTFTSDSLLETGNKAIKLMEDKLWNNDFILSKQKVFFSCSPEGIITEIAKIGSYTLTPANQYLADEIEIELPKQICSRTEQGVIQDLKNCNQLCDFKQLLSQNIIFATERLEKRERELIAQLEDLSRDNLKKMKLLSIDRAQLNSTIEHIQSTLTSNSQSSTGNEAIKLMKDSLDSLEAEGRRVKFMWSPQKLFNEIEIFGKCNLAILIGIEHERSEIHSLLSHPLATGDSWYLIHIRWFKQWKRFVGYDKWDRGRMGDLSLKPGSIDNTSLLESGELRRDQVDEIDYKLVPEKAWNMLLSQYGMTEDSVKIKRYVIMYGKFVKQCKVEVYPLELKCCLYPKESEFRIVTISRCDTIQTLENKIREKYNIDSRKQTRLYNMYMTYTYELIKDLTKEAQDVGLFDRQCVLLEVRNEDGSWPRITQATRNMQMSSYASKHSK